MKKKYKFLLIILVLFFIPTKINAEEIPIGYSEWSEESTGDPSEISAIQYGRYVPIEWSEYYTSKPTELFYKKGETLTNNYAFDGEQYTWPNVNAKTLYTWDFKEKSHLVGFYADVDTCVDTNYSNYTGPPLQLYCDDKLIASVGFHGHLDNWQPKVDCDCKLLKLTMSYGGGSGRNRTYIVSTYATVQVVQYAHVTKWSDAQDWRFDDPYPFIFFGENSQQPTERTVYSSPIKYKINYLLDGGQLINEEINYYTVLDEFKLPIAYKQGYDFLGWDNGDEIIDEIKLGSIGDLNLIALYDRHKPNISVNNYYFDQDDNYLDLKEVLRLVNASADDEVDGDISDGIVIESIKYEKDGLLINKPDYLDLNIKQSVLIIYNQIEKGCKREICYNIYCKNNLFCRLSKKLFIKFDFSI